jgi:hypothetical protein
MRLHSRRVGEVDGEQAELVVYEVTAGRGQPSPPPRNGGAPEREGSP